MKYTDRIIPELKELEAKKYALSSIPERLKTLELSFINIKATDYDTDRVSGGGENRKEAALISTIAEMDLLKQEMEITQRQVSSLEDALAKLSCEQRRVLELFFIKPEKNKVDRLCEELNCEVATVYRIKNAALIELSRRLYGQVTL